jgi:hypothetical protein
MCAREEKDSGEFFQSLQPHCSPVLTPQIHNGIILGLPYIDAIPHRISAPRVEIRRTQMALVDAHIRDDFPELEER